MTRSRAFARRASALALVGAIACGRAPPAAPPAVAAAPSGEVSEPTPPVAPPVRSCPSDAPALAVALDPRAGPVDVARRSWLLAYAGQQAVLASLADDGALATTPLGVHAIGLARRSCSPSALGAVRGGRSPAPSAAARAPRAGCSRDALLVIASGYLVAGSPFRPAPSFVMVDPSSGAPKLEPELAADGLDLHEVRWAAASARRALLVGRRSDGWAAELWSLQSADARPAAKLLAAQSLGAQVDDRHGAAFCDAESEGCAFVGIQGDGPSRRVRAFRFDASGRPSDEPLSDDHAIALAVADGPAGIVAAWSACCGDERLRYRPLDRTGAPRASVAFGAVDRAMIRNLVAVRAAATPAFGVRRDGPWALVEADPRTGAEGAANVVEAATAYFLEAVALDDGVAGAAFGSNVDYRPIGGTGTHVHSWSSRGLAFFRAVDGASDQTRSLPSDRRGGMGRGGHEVIPLAAPGRASVLVVPHGDVDVDDGPMLAPLREPCGRDSPGR